VERQETPAKEIVMRQLWVRLSFGVGALASVLLGPAAKAQIYYNMSSYPDVVISSVGFSGDPTGANPLVFNATLSNLGVNPTNYVTLNVTFLVDKATTPDLAYSQSHMNLNQMVSVQTGGSGTGGNQWTGTTDCHVVEAMVNVPHAFTESNEGNNTYAQPFYYGASLAPFTEPLNVTVVANTAPAAGGVATLQATVTDSSTPPRNVPCAQVVWNSAPHSTSTLSGCKIVPQGWFFPVRTYISGRNDTDTSFEHPDAACLPYNTANVSLTNDSGVAYMELAGGLSKSSTETDIRAEVTLPAGTNTAVINGPSCGSSSCTATGYLSNLSSSGASVPSNIAIPYWTDAQTGIKTVELGYSDIPSTLPCTEGGGSPCKAFYFNQNASYVSGNKFAYLIGDTTGGASALYALDTTNETSQSLDAATITYLGDPSIAQFGNPVVQGTYAYYLYRAYSSSDTNCPSTDSNPTICILKSDITAGTTVQAPNGYGNPSGFGGPTPTVVLNFGAASNTSSLLYTFEQEQAAAYNQIPSTPCTITMTNELTNVIEDMSNISVSAESSDGQYYVAFGFNPGVTCIGQYNTTSYDACNSKDYSSVNLYKNQSGSPVYSFPTYLYYNHVGGSTTLIQSSTTEATGLFDHVQWSPTITKYLEFSHQSPNTATVDRIWLYDMVHGNITNIHPCHEGAGPYWCQNTAWEYDTHESWSPDGTTIWADHYYGSIPSQPGSDISGAKPGENSAPNEDRGLIGYNVVDGGDTAAYKIPSSQRSIHYALVNPTTSGQNAYFIGDGGVFSGELDGYNDPSSTGNNVSYEGGVWDDIGCSSDAQPYSCSSSHIWRYNLPTSSPNTICTSLSSCSPTTLSAIPIVSTSNMSDIFNDYGRQEPNIHISPQQAWIIFSAVWQGTGDINVLASQNPTPW
jgi:hypothetical protein